MLLPQAPDNLLRLATVRSSRAFCWRPLPRACCGYLGARHPPLLPDNRHDALPSSNGGEPEGSDLGRSLLLPCVSLSPLPKPDLRHPETEVKLQVEHGSDYRSSLAGRVSLANRGQRLQAISSPWRRKPLWQWEDCVPTTGRTWCQHQAAEAGDGAGGEEPGHRQLQDHVAPRLDQQQQRCCQQESEQGPGCPNIKSQDVWSCSEVADLRLALTPHLSGCDSCSSAIMFVRNPLCVGSNTPAAVCGLVYAPSMEDGGRHQLCRFNGAAVISVPMWYRMCWSIVRCQCHNMSQSTVVLCICDSNLWINFLRWILYCCGPFVERLQLVHSKKGKYFHAMSSNVKLPQMVGRLSLREPDGVMALWL